MKHLKSNSSLGPALNRRSLAGAACALYVLAASLDGCGSARAQVVPILTEQSAPAVEYAIQDDSVSNRPILGTETALLAGTVPYLPRGAWLTILKVDSDCEQVRSAPAPISSDDLIEETAPLLAPVSQTGGTRLDIALSNVAKRAKACSGRVVEFIASDFFLDGVPPDGRSAISEAARCLAQNARVRAVYLIGPSPKSGADQALLAPLGGKLHPLNLSAVDPRGIAEGL